MKHKECTDKPRICDPGMCRYCEYAGNGNFYCTNPYMNDRESRFLVVKDWEPTENNLKCKRGGHIRGRQNKD